MAEGHNVGLIVPRREEFVDFYRAADRMGFHSLWATEWLFPSVRTQDPFALLASAASATSHIRLGGTAMPQTVRDLLTLATEAANLDHLSGGRLCLGMSPGAWPGESQGSGGPKLARIGGRLEECITLLKRLWSEAEVSFRGSHFRLEKASIPIRPVQPGGIPILVGGISFGSVRLGATLAEGCVHPSGGTPEGMKQFCQVVRAVASKVGRDPDSLELGKVIYLAIDDDRARARARLLPLQSHYGPRYNLDRWCAFGPPAECAALIRRFLDAGIKTVLLCPPRPDVDELERLHREVVPLLK